MTPQGKEMAKYPQCDTWDDYPIMTVKRLIEELQKMPQDLPVWHSGCDCKGAACAVILQKDRVLIGRSN